MIHNLKIPAVTPNGYAVKWWNELMYSSVHQPELNSMALEDVYALKLSLSTVWAVEAEYRANNGEHYRYIVRSSVSLDDALNRIDDYISNNPKWSSD